MILDMFVTKWRTLRSGFACPQGYVGTAASLPLPGQPQGWWGMPLDSVATTPRFCAPGVVGAANMLQ